MALRPSARPFPPSVLRAAVALPLALSLGCASSKPAVASAAKPAEQEEDLSHAFLDPAPVDVPAKTLVKPPPPLPDPFAEYKAAFAAGEQARAAKQWDEAHAKLGDAARLAEALGGDERAQAAEALARLELARGDAAAAQAAVLAWHAACGPEKAEPCRAEAAGVLLQVAKLPGAPAAKLKADHDEWAKADACVVQAVKLGNEPKCLTDAEHVARTQRDGWLLTHVALGRALGERNDVKQALALERVVSMCDSPQCAGLRRKALAKLIAHDLEGKNHDAALKHALLDVKVHQAAQPEALRPWGRPVETDKVCAAIDAAKGAGTCRKAEKATLGGWTFVDYSKQKAGEGLSPDTVREVNEHYLPLLQECLQDQARRLTPPMAERYEVRWMVFNDGRVGEAHLRRDLDDTELAKCLRAQFVTWRYPRYEGEWQNVEQSYTVTAVERRR